MKIAYLGRTQLSDVDLSYIHAAQERHDITYFIEINPRYNKGAAICINDIYPHNGVFKATDVYPEFNKFRNIVDLNKLYVVNTHGRFWQMKAIWTNILFLKHLFACHFNVIHIAWPLNFHEFILYVLRGKMLVTIHDPIPHTGGYGLVAQIRRYVSLALTPVIVILNETQKKEFIAKYHLNPKKVVVSRLGCYTYMHHIGHKDVQPMVKPYLLFFGRISPYKGIDYLLEAMMQVHTEYPEVDLVIAGSGNFSFDINKYTSLSYIKIMNRFIDDTELVSLIKGSIFVVCPYTDATQSGVMMSAFAFNKPVLATNVGALPETLENGKYGLIVEEKNVSALTQGIKQLLNNPSILDQMSEAINTDWHTSTKSWGTIATELGELYGAISKTSKNTNKNK